jgi:hypothetical protein
MIQPAMFRSWTKTITRLTVETLLGLFQEGFDLRSPDLRTESY